MCTISVRIFTRCRKTAKFQTMISLLPTLLIVRTIWRNASNFVTATKSRGLFLCHILFIQINSTKICSKTIAWGPFMLCQIESTSIFGLNLWVTKRKRKNLFQWFHFGTSTLEAKCMNDFNHNSEMWNPRIVCQTSKNYKMN